MSWGFSAIGKPENICAALDEFSKTQTGQSKVEFDAARPHLQALLRENFAQGERFLSPVIEFGASGSGTVETYPIIATEGEVRQVQRTCHVSIKPLSTKLV